MLARDDSVVVALVSATSTASTYFPGVVDDEPEAEGPAEPFTGVNARYGIGFWGSLGGGELATELSELCKLLLPHSSDLYRRCESEPPGVVGRTRSLCGDGVVPNSRPTSVGARLPSRRKNGVAGGKGGRTGG